MRTWIPSQNTKQIYKQKMKKIERFCEKNGIHQSQSGDSYYFTLNGVHYRVSNHSVERSDEKAYNMFGEQVREKYHNGREKDTVYIHASKTRVIEIYQDLKERYKLNGRGKRIG